MPAAMSRRARQSSEQSVTDSVRSLGRAALQYVNLPGDHEWFRESDAFTNLGHQLSTRSAISTTSTLAREYQQAMNDGAYELRHIGEGQCGTVFGVVETTFVVKVLNNPSREEQLHNDFSLHGSISEAFNDFTIDSQIGLNVPEVYSWLRPEFEQWKELTPMLPEVYSNSAGAIVSERIFPLPQSTREAIIAALCPIPLQAIATRDPENKDCLVRIYMGRTSSLRSNNRFKLRNVPLYVDDMEKIGLDTEAYARTLASSLAVLHWKAKVDARDVEFVIGSKPLTRPRPLAGETRNISAMDDSTAQAATFVFTKRTTHLWLLDFNECSSFVEDDGNEWLDKLCDGFNANDPYYPRPNTGDTTIQGLWLVFKAQYLHKSAEFTGTDAPARFIKALEASKNTNNLF